MSPPTVGSVASVDISTFGSSNIAIRGNKIQTTMVGTGITNPIFTGIDLTGSYSMTVTDNDVSVGVLPVVSGIGIQATASSNCVISNNILNATGPAIQDTTPSFTNTICGNTFISNGGAGPWLRFLQASFRATMPLHQVPLLTLWVVSTMGTILNARLAFP